MSWAIAGILVVGAVLSLLEVPRLLKEKLKKELWWYSSLMVFGLGLAIAKEADVQIPNPLDWLIALYQPLSDVVFRFLE